MIAVSRAVPVEGSCLIVNSESMASDVKPLVIVKGTKEGLLFLLDESAPYEALLEYVEQMFNGEGASLFSGPSVAISVDYGSRALTAAECSGLIRAFLAHENFVLKEWGPKTAARQSLFANRGGRSSHQTVFKGTVRSGQQLLFDGDVVVIGDVNPGGEVQATGDIYVFGRLRGMAHAGIYGNESSIIAATEFAPMQLRISDVVSRAPEVNGRPLHTFMEFAYLQQDGMAVDKMQYYPTIRQRALE
jgi:septum site-determining protein MinC